MSQENTKLSNQVLQMYKDRNIQLDDTAKIIQKILANKNRSQTNPNAVITSQRLHQFITETCPSRAHEIVV